MKLFFKRSLFVSFLAIIAAAFIWATVYQYSKGDRDDDDDEAVSAQSFVHKTKIVLNAATLKLTGIKSQPAQPLGQDQWAISESAILRQGRRVYVYLENPPGNFMRSEVAVVKTSAQGLVTVKPLHMSSGWRNAQAPRIVTIGAGELFSEQFKASFKPEDD